VSGIGFCGSCCFCEPVRVMDVIMCTCCSHGVQPVTSICFCMSKCRSMLCCASQCCASGTVCIR
jgi:hypothetical protein